MNVELSELSGVLVIQTDCYSDLRGYFKELWNEERYSEHGLPRVFRQDNISVSRRGVLRGMHYQQPCPQGKLVGVLDGEVYDVVVDIRRSSPTFGKWSALIISADNCVQVYIPEGFAHGFQVLSERATFFYKCTAPYHPGGETTLRWDDPDVGVRWPLADAVISPKDARGALLKDIPPERLF